MKKLVPSPLLSGVLWLVWLLLNNSVHPAHVVLGAALAVAVPLVTQRLRPDRPRLARPGIALRLAAVVAWDIVVSNLEVTAAQASVAQRLAALDAAKARYLRHNV